MSVFVANFLVGFALVVFALWVFIGIGRLVNSVYKECRNDDWFALFAMGLGICCVLGLIVAAVVGLEQIGSAFYNAIR